MNKIYQGNCLEIMKQIPDESIDMILTDPPYGIDFKSAWQTYQKRIENDKLEDWQILLPKMLSEFKRILKPDGCCCCCGGGGKTPVTAIFTLEAIKYFNLIQTVVWRKFIGLGWRYRPAYENIVILSKNKDKYNFYDTSKKCANLIEGINQKIPRKGEHPTQKPVELMEHFLKIHSKEGDIILDPFNGGGSTGVACKNLKRQFFGCELSPEYCEIAKARTGFEIIKSDIEIPQIKIENEVKVNWKIKEVGMLSKCCNAKIKKGYCESCCELV
jgi:site-specific DNA-methyltransferase (adenine-specific)